MSKPLAKRQPESGEPPHIVSSLPATERGYARARCRPHATTALARFANHPGARPAMRIRPPSRSFGSYASTAARYAGSMREMLPAMSSTYSSPSPSSTNEMTWPPLTPRSFSPVTWPFSTSSARTVPSQ